MPKRTTFSSANAGVPKPAGRASALAPARIERRENLVLPIMGSPEESKRGAAQPPRRGALVGGAGGEDAGFVERPAGELEGERKAVAAEAAAHGERGLAGDVERHAERGFAEEVEDRLRLLED